MPSLDLTGKEVDDLIYALARAEDDIQDIFDEPSRAADYSRGDLEDLSAEKTRLEKIHQRLIGLVTSV